MALSGQVSCGFRHGTVDARQVPLAALKPGVDLPLPIVFPVDARQVPLAALKHCFFHDINLLSVDAR